MIFHVQPGFCYVLNVCKKNEDYEKNNGFDLHGRRGGVPVFLRFRQKCGDS